MPTLTFRPPGELRVSCRYFCWLILSESYTSFPQGTDGCLSSFSWGVFPRLRNARPSVATLLMHASCQGHFSSDFSACVLPWTVSERSCSPLNRGENIPIKLPPKILAKSLKMNGIQSSFEVLNGCDMCFSPTSVSGEAADHRCLMLHVCGGASWDEKAEHLTFWKRKDSVGELASHPFFRGEVRAQVQEDQRQLLFHILYELVLFQPEGKKFWPPFIWWRQKKKRREQWGRTNRQE